MKMISISFRNFLLILGCLLPVLGFGQEDELTPHWDHDTLEVKPGLTVYPNPARDYVIINFQEEVDRVKEISIRDLHGKEVNCWVPSPRIESDNKIFMWTGDLKDGAYFYMIQTLNEQFTGRFIISRSVMIQ